MSLHKYEFDDTDPPVCVLLSQHRQQYLTLYVVCFDYFTVLIHSIQHICDVQIQLSLLRLHTDVVLQ